MSPAKSPAPGYWLLKTDVSSYAIDDLARDRQTCWDGVRNYQARNYLRDGMKVGDLALIYHSNAEPSGVAGVAEICRTAYPDHTAWDPHDKHFDEKSTPEDPIWLMVDVAFIERFPQFLTLEDLKNDPDLATMGVCQRGSRLSIHPVSAAHFKKIVKRGRGKG